MKRDLNGRTDHVSIREIDCEITRRLIRPCALRVARIVENNGKLAAVVIPFRVSHYSNGSMTFIKSDVVAGVS